MSNQVEANRKQREYRAANGNAVTQRYERTPQGKLMRTYRNMQSRVLGILKTKRHLYEGKEILSRDAFYAWAQASPEFRRLFDGWVASGYRCGASPSVDRIDPTQGYTLSNMEWVTHSENSRRSSRAGPRHHADVA
jgi:hypothetical protein